MQNRINHTDRLRVAFIVGTLRQGGAEKQLVLLAKALRAVGVDVRAYCLTKSEHYESVLAGQRIPTEHVGRCGNPVIRIANIARSVAKFKPHILQSTHAYTNLYASIVGRIVGAISVGTIRSSIRLTRENNGLWTDLLIRTPTALTVNSACAIRELKEIHPTRSSRFFYFPNAIDLSEYNCTRSHSKRLVPGSADVQVLFVGRFTKVKRIQHFIRALYLARKSSPNIKGVMIGDGPDREQAEQLATTLGLLPRHLQMMGHSDRVPEVMRESDMLVFTSRDEGSPNVILEALATGLPVVSTPAGDAVEMIKHGRNGFLVDVEDQAEMSRRICELAGSTTLRQAFGNRGRQWVEQERDLESLASRALSIYRLVSLRRPARNAFDIPINKPHGAPSELPQTAQGVPCD